MQSQSRAVLGPDLEALGRAPGAQITPTPETHVKRRGDDQGHDEAHQQDQCVQVHGAPPTVSAATPRAAPRA